MLSLLVFYLGLKSPSFCLETALIQMRILFLNLQRMLNCTYVQSKRRLGTAKLEGISLNLFWDLTQTFLSPFQWGVMKGGRGTCSTFKVFNLTYLHVLRAVMVYMYRLTLYVHVPMYLLAQHNFQPLFNSPFQCCQSNCLLSNPSLISPSTKLDRQTHSTHIRQYQSPKSLINFVNKHSVLAWTRFKKRKGKFNCVLYILTSFWVLCTLNAGWQIFFFTHKNVKRKKKKEI